MTNKLMQSVWKLVSTTREDFDMLYGATLSQYQSVIRDEEHLNKALQRTLHVLKIRRGFMLPKGRDAETCYQQHSVWTFALFTSSLMLDAYKFLNIPSDKNGDAIQRVLPKHVKKWISEYPNVLETFRFDPENIRSSHNVLAEIIYQAQKRKSKSKQVVGTLSDAFITWLNDELIQKHISVNDDTGYLHHVENGVLVVMPRAYNEYISRNAEAAKSYLQANQSFEHFIELIGKDSSFIKSHNGLLHDYYRGDWSSRDVIRGVLVKAGALSRAADKPLNKKLQPDIKL